MNKWDNIQRILTAILIIVLVFGLIPSLFKLLIAADIISYDGLSSNELISHTNVTDILSYDGVASHYDTQLRVVNNIQAENGAYFKVENGENTFIAKITNKFSHKYNGIVITSFYEELIHQKLNLDTKGVIPVEV